MLIYSVNGIKTHLRIFHTMAKRKRNGRAPKLVVAIVFILSSLAACFIPNKNNLLSIFSKQTTEPVPEQLELPAPLTDRPETILRHKGYTTSYNATHKVPNWVAWTLSPEKLIEAVSRTNKFLPDPQLSADEAVTTDDYKNCGMDRGHMCPAGDNKWSLQAMRESFYMTNICPQNHNLNRGDWKELEEMCRDWARKEGTVYIVCGPIFYNKRHKTIGKEHEVTVPEAFFKVVLAMGQEPKAIGFIFKNASGNNPLDMYVNSVDEVERITGIDFFPTLPDETEKQVEATYNIKDWLDK